MCVQTLYSLQAYIITVLAGLILIVRYLWCSIFGVRISGIPSSTNMMRSILFFLIRTFKWTFFVSVGGLQLAACSVKCPRVHFTHHCWLQIQYSVVCSSTILRSFYLLLRSRYIVYILLGSIMYHYLKTRISRKDILTKDRDYDKVTKVWNPWLIVW